jgi:hypothetical protein
MGYNKIKSAGSIGASASNFLVETGESRTPRPEEAVQDLLQA